MSIEKVKKQLQISCPKNRCVNHLDGENVKHSHPWRRCDR